MTVKPSPLISATVSKEIDQWIKKYPKGKQRSALLIALRLVQEENGGWLTVELMDAVAEYLELPKIAVYEVVSFYSMFHTKPIGKYRLGVCNSISCALNGSKKIIEHLEHKLGIHEGETTEDGMFTLQEAECLAACVCAPMMQVNYKEIHENLTPERVDAIIEEIRRKEAAYAE